jgi:RNA polymerase sigma-70 factor (ECF subfamily)
MQQVDGDMRRKLSANDEGRLVTAAAKGNSEAFEALVQHYCGMVYAIAFARLKNAETAEDLVQEVFVRVFLNLEKLTQPRFFGTWVSRIARNLAMDWVRREQHRSELLTLVSLEGDRWKWDQKRAQEAQDKLEEQERIRAVRLAIEELSAEQRELIMLHFSEGLTMREIARLMEVHPTTAARQLESALMRIREFVAEPAETCKTIRPIVNASSRKLQPAPDLTRRIAAATGVVAGLSAAAKSSLCSAAQLEPALYQFSSSASPGWITTVKAMAAVCGNATKVAILSKSSMAAFSICAIAAGGYYAVKLGPVAGAPIPAINASSTVHAVEIRAEDWALGTWVGSLTFTGAPRPIAIVYNVRRDAHGKLTVSAQSPDQGFASIRADTVEITPGRFHVYMASVRADFEAKPAGTNRIAGTFTQGGDSLKLDLRRVEKSEPVPQTAPLQLDSKKLAQYQGYFAYDPKTTATIFLKNGELTMRSTRFSSDTRLIPLSEDTFQLDGETVKAIFSRNAGGQIDRVTFRIETAGLKRDHMMRKVQ